MNRAVELNSWAELDDIEIKYLVCAEQFPVALGELRDEIDDR